MELGVKLLDQGSGFDNGLEGGGIVKIWVDVSEIGVLLRV